MVYFATLSGVWRARPIRSPNLGLVDKRAQGLVPGNVVFPRYIMTKNVVRKHSDYRRLYKVDYKGLGVYKRNAW